MISLVQFWGSTSERLRSIVKQFHDSNPKRDWRFYFIKYPSILEASYWGSQKLYEFAWPNDDFQIRALTKDNLRGRHINPFSLAVSILVNDKSVCDIEYSWVSDFADEPLYLANGVRLSPFSDGWKVYLSDCMEDLPQNILSTFNLRWNDKDEYYLLAETKEKDRIEIAVKFCKAAYNL